MNTWFMTMMFEGLQRSAVHAAWTIVALLVLERIAPRLPAAWRSWIWRIAYLKIALVSVMPWVLTWHCLPGNGWTQSTAVATSPQMIQPDALTIHLPRLDDDVPSQRNERQSVTMAPPTSPRWQMRETLFALWMLGTVVCLLRYHGQWRRASALRRRSTVCDDPRVFALVQRLCQQFRLSIRPSVRTIPGDGSPLLVGTGRPCVLLPQRFLLDSTGGRVSDETLRTALAHELAHLCRRDLAWNHFVAIVHAILFWHPLMWFAIGRYHAAQEAACDALAIDRAGVNRSRLADLLIEVSRRPSSSGVMLAGVPLAPRSTRQALVERLRAMQVHPKSKRYDWLARSVVLVAGFAALAPWTLGIDRTAAAQSAGRLTDEPGTKQTQPSTGGISVSGSASASASGGGVAVGSQGSNIASGTARAKSSVSVTSNNLSEATAASKPSPSSRSTTNSSSSTTRGDANVSITRETTDEGETIRVIAQEKRRTVLIRQSDADGIEVRLVPFGKDNQDEEIVVTAETPAELKKNNSAAYAAYRKYLERELKNLDRDTKQPAIPNPPKNNPAAEMMREQLKSLMNDESLPEQHRELLKQSLQQLKP